MCPCHFSTFVTISETVIIIQGKLKLLENCYFGLPYGKMDDTIIALKKKKSYLNCPKRKYPFVIQICVYKKGVKKNIRDHILFSWYFYSTKFLCQSPMIRRWLGGVDKNFEDPMISSQDIIVIKQKYHCLAFYLNTI